MSIFNIPMPAGFSTCDTKILVARTRAGRQVTVFQTMIPAFRYKEPTFADDTCPPTPAVIVPLPNRGPGLKMTNETSLNELYELFPQYYDPFTEPKNQEIPAVGEFAAKVALVDSLEALQKLEGFVLSEGASSILQERYPEDFGFLVCPFKPKRGVKPRPIAVIHDLMCRFAENLSGLYVPLYNYLGHADESTEPVTELMDHAIFTINACPFAGAGILCKGKNKKIKTILSSLEDILPRKISLRRLELRAEHENEDLIFFVDPASIVEEKIYIVHQNLTAVAIETSAEVATAWPPCFVVEYSYSDDLAPVMYIIMEHNKKTGTDKVWDLSSDLNSLVSKFIAGPLEAVGALHPAAVEPKTVKVELLTRGYDFESRYKLSIVTKDD